MFNPLAGLASLTGPFWLKLSAGIIVLLLTSTLVLGALLKAEIAHSSKQEALLEEAHRGQARLSLQLQQKGESCQATIDLLTQNIKVKKLSDKATKALIDQVEEVLNEKPKTEPAAGMPPAVFRLLDSATCQARNNGIPCSTSTPNGPV